MACWGAAARNFLISARRSVVHRRRNPRSSGFLRPFRVERFRYARADLSNASFGRQRVLRFVRNPMYVAVVSLILGQGLFFGSIRLLEYGIAVCVGFYLFVLIYEEPVLRKSYGREYEEFFANVPRWIPRLRPWRRKPE